MRALVSTAIERQDICTIKDVELLFRASESHTILDKFFWCAADAPPSDGTEDSFHSFWDGNIRHILELLLPTGKSFRNSGKHTATRKLRPDYAFVMNNFCPFRGEENAPGNSDDPKLELSEKLVWAYKRAPYVLGKLCPF